MKIKNIAVLFSSLFMAFSYSGISSASSSFSCQGSIKQIGVHSVDRVMLKLSGMNTVVNICKLNETVGTDYPITAESCKVIYSTLLSAYSLGKSMNILFDNVQSGTSCANFSSWELATARWVYLSGE